MLDSPTNDGESLVLEMPQRDPGLAALLDLNRRMMRAGTEDDVVRAVLESTTPTLADCAAIELLATDGRPHRTSCVPEASAEHLRGSPELERARERALRSPEPSCLAPRLPDDELASEHAWSAVLLVPLRAHGAVLGVLTLARRLERAPFRSADVEVAEAVAGRAALAVAAHRAQHEELHARERAERAALRFEALRRTAVDMAAATSTAEVFGALSAHARTLLGAQRAAFVTPSARPGWLQLLSPGADPGEVPDLGMSIRSEEPLPITRAYNEGRAVYYASRDAILADLPAPALLGEHGALVVAPLRWGERVFGALALCFAEERSFGEDDRALVETLAGQAAVVLEHVRLYERAQRTAEQQALLARASEALDGSLEPDAALEQVTALAVPALADAAAAFLFEPEGDVRLVGLHHVDPAMVDRARDIARCWPLTQKDFGDVAARGEALLFAEVDEDVIDLGARDPSHREALRSLGLRSCVVAPLQVQGRVRGALAFVWSGSARYHDASDLDVARDLARRASTAFERAALYADIRAAEEAAEKSRRLFERMASASPDTLFVVATNAARVLYVNQLLGHDPAWLRSLGPAVVEALVHPDDLLRVRQDIAATRERRDGEILSQNVRLRHADGTYRWIELRSLVFARDDAGRPTELLGVARDVTRDHEREEALRRSEETHRLATEAVRGLVYEWDIETGRVVLSPGVRDLIGFDASEVPDRIEWWLGRVHPDDAVTYGARWTQLEGAPPPVSDIQYRVLHRGGAWRHVWDRACVLADDRGRVRRLVGCVIDVTDRVRAQEVLEQADRRKTEFIALLGHELRNPLAAIRSAAHLLDLVGSAETRPARARDVIVRQVGHMARLLDDLLDLSRIERGKLSLQLEPLDLRELVRHCAEDHRAEIERAGARLSVSLPPEPVETSGDATRIAQVLGNLVHNATKFSRPGGLIELSLRADGERAELAVRDDGIGIDAGVLERIFEPFEQDERRSTRSRGGLGLGLALVRGLVELHGGAVRAESGGSGRGATFLVTLPVRAAEAEARAVSEPPARARRRVLVVEDNEDAAEMLRLLLEHHGHQVEVAHDGPEALALARAAPPEVVFCDIGLPGPLSGYDVARALREDPATRSARLVAVTGYGQESDQRRAHDAGFDRHVTKPVDPRTIDQLLVP